MTMEALSGTFTFVREDGGDVRLELLASSPLIRARAAYLRAAVPPSSPVGLMFPSGPDLVLNWLATLAAGLKPLIMQYPTAKQARTYWTSSVSHTLSIAGLQAVVCDEYCRDQGLAKLCRIIPPDALAGLPPGVEGPLAVADFEILQLSSGTTGHRKGVAFRSDALRRHIEDYNRSIRLTRADRIVSWLPLYHDMGYVACFVMPMMLGVDVVMMDPMVWVRRPELLFDAIERHAGTVCYMPNFGFELMSRCAPRTLPTMRRWISCSEPISAVTSNKFLAAIGAAAETFSPCYAMAENIFALSIREGLELRQLDGADVVSCGRPIEGVEVKVVEGEIWARSPTSLAAYVDGKDIRDGEGFYPTGDTGAILDGEIYVAGRKQDILIQAGRKYLLSDVDLRLNELLPEVRGRAAALALRDEHLGTESLTVLVESQEFIERSDTAQIENALSAACGVEPVRVAFVPPRFLTKTSSGKFNRRISGGHWSTVRDRAGAAGTEPSDLLQLLAGYRDLPQHEPISKILDSLSLTVVRGLMRDASLPFSWNASLRQIEEQMRTSRDTTPSGAGPDTIRIVSVAEGRLLFRLRPQHLQALSRLVGRPVELEHVCVPPSALLLSDLIFQEYFSPRIPAQDFASVDRVLNKIRGASVILADDAYDLYWPKEQVYGVLSHNLERDPRADRLSFRCQAYTRQNDRLPLSVVDGALLPLDQSSATLCSLGQYLGVPLFRIANIPEFSPYTTDWEYHPLTGQSFAGLDPDALVAALGAWINARSTPLNLRPAQPQRLLELSDPPHFCSTLVRQAPIDTLIDKFQSFLVVGPPASVPYLRQQIERRGKRYMHLPSFAPQVLATAADSYDCMLICGAIGPGWPPGKRAAALQHIGHASRTQNLDDVGPLGPFNERPTGHRDWFCSFELDGSRDLAVWAATRQAHDARQRAAFAVES